MRPFILRRKGVKEDRSGEGLVLTSGAVVATIYLYGKMSMNFDNVPELERHLIETGGVYEISFFRSKYILDEKDFDKVNPVKTTPHGTSRKCSECGREQLYKSNGYWQRVHNPGCSKARVRHAPKMGDPFPDYVHFEYLAPDRRTCKECRSSQTLILQADKKTWAWKGGHPDGCANANAVAPVDDPDEGGACTGGSYVGVGGDPPARKCKKCLAVQTLKNQAWTGKHNPGCSTYALEVRNGHHSSPAQASS